MLNNLIIISYGSVCELETQTLLGRNFGLIEKVNWVQQKKTYHKIERMLKALIKSLENKHFNPCPLESLDPLLQPNWRRTTFFNIHPVIFFNHASLYNRALRRREQKREIICSQLESGTRDRTQSEKAVF